MQSDLHTLCQRILEKCQRQRWYGGDKHNTVQFRTQGRRYEEYIDPKGNEIVIDNDPDDHPRKRGFAYPPATEEQLRATQQAWGFPLPLLLRLLYAQLANGGFGPGYGLLGAFGGYDEAGNFVEMYQYHRRRAQLVDLTPFLSNSEKGSSFELPETHWPRAFIYLCNWGDAQVSCLDCTTEHVFLVRLGEKPHQFILEFQAASLQTWLEQWVNQQPVLEPEQDSPVLLDGFDPFVDHEGDSPDDW